MKATVVACLLIYRALDVLIGAFWAGERKVIVYGPAQFAGTLFFAALHVWAILWLAGA